jgi:hypothetical protein
MGSLSPSDAIEATWLPTYQKQRHAIVMQLIELNCSLFLIERIEEFPFKVFLPLTDNGIFWRLTKSALIEKSLMIIWRVVVDTGSDSLTVRHFKNEVLQHIPDSAVKEQLCTTLRNIDFESRMTKLKDKVVSIRHNYLAHLNREMNINPDPLQIADVSISLKELAGILNTAQDLFNTLCFNEYHSLWYLGYLDSTRNNRITDIDKLLDSIARNSWCLNLPEQDPEDWERFRPKLTADELATINAYRRRFRLPEA